MADQADRQHRRGEGNDHHVICGSGRIRASGITPVTSPDEAAAITPRSGSPEATVDPDPRDVRKLRRSVLTDLFEMSPDRCNTGPSSDPPTNAHIQRALPDADRRNLHALNRIAQRRES